ncbi:MAG TPA: LarC family nickel insertion protein [Thermoanaerobaculia bacterium]|nr:LarC family nickel insertion protein [Thermoanaerobaculia bacterium]
MRVLYIDSIGGLAGDMFLAASLDAGFVTLEELQGLVSAWLPERVRLSSETVERNAMRARTFRVEVEHGHTHDHHHEHHDHSHGHSHQEHRNLADVEALLDRCPMPRGAVERARAMFRELARAEAHVHGQPIDTIHFHEVGATDSLVDFALSALVLDRLGARVEASPAVVGRGRVPMAHGYWPVPPPGTAEVLRAGNVPTRSLPSDFPWENAELTTPTGSCLLRNAERFGDLPAGAVLAVGMGAGTLDIPGYPNVTRLVLVEAGKESTGRFDADRIAVLETWIDDMPGNLLSIAVDELLAAGALDVGLSPVTMKKGRAGHRLEVLAPLDRKDVIAEMILGRTTAIGLRVSEVDRLKLYRSPGTTPDGIATKVVHDASGAIARSAPETEALQERAKKGGPAPMFGWRIEDGSEKRG